MTRPPRIAFLLRRPKSANSTSRFRIAMRTLEDLGARVEVIGVKGCVFDLRSVEVRHDLYVLKQISGVSLSLAGALHAQGAAIVNPYPISLALRDKIVASRTLEAAGVPTPATYVAWRAELLTPLLEQGALVVKPYDGTGGYGVRVVHEPDQLPPALENDEPILAQRYHPPEGPDLKIYVIGERVFGVRKKFPAVTEKEKHGCPFDPTARQREIALQCGEAFGIDLYGVDLIESGGRLYVVDMGSLPSFKGVPDAGALLAGYFYRAAERARDGHLPGTKPPPALRGDEGA